MSRHPNIANFHTCFIDGKDAWLVMPIFEGGSVASLIASCFPHGFDNEAIIAAILLCLLEGINYLHKQGLVHRDVKSSNLLIDKSGNICLSDFGISLFYMEEYIQAFAGTPCWMAPEMLSEKCICNFKTDIWALGVTAIELAEGKVPYSDLPEEKVRIHINSCR